MGSACSCTKQDKQAQRKNKPAEKEVFLPSPWDMVKFLPRDDDNKLIEAVKQGRQDTVYKLLNTEPKPNVNYKNSLGRTAAMLAAAGGHSNILELLLAEGAKVNTVDNKGKTALMYATKRGQLQCLGILIEAGADLNVCNNHGNTALMHAVLVNNEECLQLFIKSGAALNIANTNGQTPLIVATLGEYAGCMRQLIAAGANVNKKCGNDGRTALMIASGYGYLECTALLLRAAADVNATDNLGRTPVIHAVLGNHQDCLQLLVNAGAKVRRIHDKYSLTALMYAARKGFVGCIKILVDKGADVNALDRHGYSAIVFATVGGHKSCVKELKYWGAFVKARHRVLLRAASLGHHQCLELVQWSFMKNARNERGMYPLMVAAENGHWKFVKELLLQGALINQSDPHGYTALMYAISKGQTRCIAILEQANGHVNTSPEVLIHAIKKGHLLVIKKLVSLGADVNVFDPRGLTPLMVAAYEGNKECVDFLLRAGSDVNVGDLNDNCTALMYAACQGRSDVIELLVEYGAEVNQVDKKGQTALMHVVLKRKTQSFQDSAINVNICLLGNQSSYKSIKTLLELGAHVNIMDSMTTIEYLLLEEDANNSYKRTLELMWVAGELTGHITMETNSCSLKHKCRTVIRKHLLSVNIMENLIYRINQLKISEELRDFLLYNKLLEDETTDENNSGECDGEDANVCEELPEEPYMEPREGFLDSLRYCWTVCYGDFDNKNFFGRLD